MSDHPIDLRDLRGISGASGRKATIDEMRDTIRRAAAARYSSPVGTRPASSIANCSSVNGGESCDSSLWRERK